MPAISIDSINDPRLSPYRNLKERELARDGGRFIAESEHVVRRLLLSDYPVESVLIASRRADEISSIVPDHIPLFVVPDELIHQVIGFRFHSGVIACGFRKEPASLHQLLTDVDKPSLIVVCPELASHENLGSLIRICSAFGADAMILGERCCDPFYRLSIRVSMGNVFAVPMLQTENLHRDLQQLRDAFGYELLATVLDETAESLENIRPARRTAILFGNEAQGLSQAEITACHRKVTIPMHRGTDSLNVSVAAGIVMYHFTKSAS